MKIDKKIYNYFHMHPKERFIISLGMDAREFVTGISRFVSNMLLIQHQIDDVYGYNANTKLNYLNEKEIGRFLEDTDSKFKCCSWIDFDAKENLNEISAQELSELLYLAHMKHHYRTPFYPKLNNHFVFLTGENSSYCKLYFRDWSHVAEVISEKIATGFANEMVERNFFVLTKKSSHVKIPNEIVEELMKLFQEGLLFSFAEVEQKRNHYEMPLWIMGDYQHEDVLVEDFAKMKRKQAKWYLIYSKKTKEWQLEHNA